MYFNILLNSDKITKNMIKTVYNDKKGLVIKCIDKKNYRVYNDDKNIKYYTIVNGKRIEVEV